MPYVHKNKFSQSEKFPGWSFTHKYFFLQKLLSSPLCWALDESRFSLSWWGTRIFPFQWWGKLFFVSGNYFPWTREPSLMLLFKNNSFIWTLDNSKTYLKQFICFPFVFFLLMITQAIISTYFHVPGCLISSDDSKILCQGIYCNTEQKIKN